MGAPIPQGVVRGPGQGQIGENVTALPPWRIALIWGRSSMRPRHKGEVY